MNNETALECLQLVAATLTARAKGEVDKLIERTYPTPLPKNCATFCSEAAENMAVSVLRVRHRGNRGSVRRGFGRDATMTAPTDI